MCSCAVTVVEPSWTRTFFMQVRQFFRKYINIVCLKVDPFIWLYALCVISGADIYDECPFTPTTHLSSSQEHHTHTLIHLYAHTFDTWQSNCLCPLWSCLVFALGSLQRGRGKRPQTNPSPSRPSWSIYINELVALAALRSRNTNWVLASYTEGNFDCV